ncbi:MAG: hypothetical protein GY953_47825, partial [bacterium]|nr:hypothetical protein [bacterium]
MIIQPIATISLIPLISAGGEGWWLAPALLVDGFAWGAAFSLLVSMLLADVPKDLSGVASGTQVSVRLLAGALGGAMTASMIHLGDRLGLYSVLADAGAVTSADLAAKTGLDERWLREWLYQQGAAGVLEYRDGRFALSPEGRAVLADEGHPAFGAGFFSHLPETL